MSMVKVSKVLFFATIVCAILSFLGPLASRALCGRLVCLVGNPPLLRIVGNGVPKSLI